MRQCWVDKIGYAAYQALQENTSGMVIGVTSRGLFLLLGGDQILFLTQEPHLSPLTATLQKAGCSLSVVQTRDRVEVLENLIRIGGGMDVFINEAVIWQPPLPQRDELIHGDVVGRVIEVARRLLDIKGEVGWAGYLAYLTGPRDAPPPGEFLLIDRQVNFLHVAMFSERVENVRTALKPFFGLGRGLTPSGDDFIIGMTLVLSRWPQVVRFHPNLGDLLEGIVGDAHAQTTRISQAMIASAAQGYADERLMYAIDGIITGNLSAEECAGLLAGYGGSSGVDALVGVSALFII